MGADPSDGVTDRGVSIGVIHGDARQMFINQHHDAGRGISGGGRRNGREKRHGR